MCIGMMYGNCEYCGNELLKDGIRFCSIVCFRKGYSVSKETKKKISIGNKGKIVSEETRKKLSIVHKGKIVSEETRKKLSIVHKGKIVSEEMKAKISIALKGKVLSEETRKKMSIVRKGHPVSEETRKKLSTAHKGKPGHKWSEEIRKKISERMQSKEVQDTRKQTCFKNWGCKHPMQSDTLRDRIRIDNFNYLLTSDRIGEEYEFVDSLEEYKGVHGYKYKIRHKVCGNIFDGSLDSGNIPICQICFPANYGKSHYEDEIVKWLEELNIQNIEPHNRTILKPKELDVYLPEYKLGIEFNGLVWHSEIVGHKDKNYHINKTLECEKQGIQLVHIFEDEWLNEYKQEIVKSILKSKFNLIENRVYARNCTVKQVPSIEAKAFLYYNHLQTTVNCKYWLGLYHEHALVYLIGVSKPRFNTNYQFELVRSCPKINTLVLGGFSKLIKHVVNTLNISTMISYVDRRYFTGKGYTGNWKLIHSTSPNYYYTKGYERESRVKYQRHKLETLFSTTYEANLTEWEIMNSRGYDRIYDCGNLVFEYRKEVTNE